MDRFANWQQQDFYSQIFCANSSSVPSEQPDAYTAAYQDVASSQLGGSSSGPQVDTSTDLPQHGPLFPSPQPQPQQEPRESELMISLTRFLDTLMPV